MSSTESNNKRALSEDVPESSPKKAKVDKRVALSILITNEDGEQSFFSVSSFCDKEDDCYKEIGVMVEEFIRKNWEGEDLDDDEKEVIDKLNKAESKDLVEEVLDEYLEDGGYTFYLNKIYI